MGEETKKISANRQKKMDIVTKLTGKFGRANAIVFTNYQGITHKQLESFKKAIKPLKADYVVAKNSLLTLALGENKYKLEKDMVLDGQTGTLFLYEDVIPPLKALAKTIKELNLPSVKFGIMDHGFVTGEQVLKLSTLPTREVLLTQLVGGLKSPIFGLHRALNWNLQKLVMTLNAVVGVKPAIAVATAKATPTTPLEPIQAPIVNPEPEISVAQSTEGTSAVQSLVEESEPETILAEKVEEKIAELPETDNPTIKAETNSPSEGTKSTDEDNKGGEN